MFNLMAEANQCQQEINTTQLEPTNVYNPVKVVCERDFFHAVLFCKCSIFTFWWKGQSAARLSFSSPSLKLKHMHFASFCFILLRLRLKVSRSVFKLKMRIWGADKTEFPASCTSKAGVWHCAKDLKQSIWKHTNDIRLLVHSWFSGKLSEIWCCFCTFKHRTLVLTKVKHGQTNHWWQITSPTTVHTMASKNTVPRALETRGLGHSTVPMFGCQSKS